MEVKNKKYLFSVVALLILIEICSIFLMYKSSNNEIKLDNVSLKEQRKTKDTFAVMLGDKNGVYTESDSNVWPSNLMYIYNEERSGCIDIEGNKIDNAISYDNETSKATIMTSVTSYCYLYFDVDTVVPQSFIFYLGGNTNPTYATSTSVSAYLSWSDKDIASYCVTNTNSSSGCTWNTVSGTNITGTHTLTSTDGTKTVYAYLKDAAGNISSAVTDTIVLDTTKPVISSVEKTSDEKESISIKVTASDTNNIETYYYKIGTGSYTSSTSNTYTFTGLTKGTTYDVSVYVKDKAGNESTVTTVSYETAKPATGEEILANPTTGLNTSTPYGGLYRYIGTSANNYVKIGSYTYRIIGIVAEDNDELGLKKGQLKVIKTSSVTTRTWDYQSNSKRTWNAGGTVAELYTYLNSTYVSNTSYFPSGWSSKIDSPKWYVGDVTSNIVVADTIFSEEKAAINNGCKIGLMYLSDYYYAYNAGGTRICYGDGANGTSCKSWITSGSDEWTMTQRYTTSIFGAYRIYSYGYTSSGQYYDTYDVRPVFYLTEDVYISGGTGTSGSPFVLAY